jgi:enoyl-[acyl-carrier protein] reductase II
MIWASGWKLASAVSNAGGLGLIGAGSMSLDILDHHLKQCKENSKHAFGVNLPLLYHGIQEQIDLIIKHEVPIVFTSAGNPKTWTNTLKAAGIKVVHVVSSSKFALKCQDAGVDAVVAEGFEAGGHNGREETTTMCLIPEVRNQIEIPLIAAGGIGDARSMMAAMILGAEGVQIGSRFVCTPEASSHPAFKEKIIEAGEGSTELVLKKLTPVRLLKNPFYELVKQAENQCVEKEQLEEILGKGRARKGMLEGDLTEGELEIGQVSSTIRSIMPAAQIVEELWQGFNGLFKTIAEKTN